MSVCFPVEEIIIQSTPYCNLNCKYCYLPNRDDRSRTNPILLADVLRYLHLSGYASPKMDIIWHAGEPLAAGLRFYKETMEHVSAANLPYSVIHNIQTNATLINDNWCSFFKDHDFKIGVSLDGPEFIHDHNRVFRSGKGSFALTMRGIQLLQSYGINPHLIAVVTSKSLNYADEIYDFFEKIGIRRAGFNIEEECLLAKNLS